MNKWIKRLGAIAMAVCMVVGAVPSVAKAAETVNMSFRSVSYSAFEEGVSTDRKIGDLLIQSTGGQFTIVPDKDYWISYYDSDSKNSYYEIDGPDGFSPYVNDKSEVFVKTTSDVPKGTYYFRISFRKSVTDQSNDNKTTVYEGITDSTIKVQVGDNTSVTSINNISITVPTTLPLGTAFSKIMDGVSVTTNNSYKIMDAGSSYYRPIEMKVYDLNRKELTIGTATNAEPPVINKSRIYRLTVLLEAAKDCVFPEGTTTQTAFGNSTGKVYAGVISGTTVSSIGTEVRESDAGKRKLLAIAYEYLVDANGVTTVSSSSSAITNAVINISANNITTLPVTIAGTSATISEIPEATVNALISGNTAANLVLDLATVNSQLTTATLDYLSVSRAGVAINNTNNGIKALELRLPKATAVFDAAAVNSILAQGNSGNISVTLSEISTNSLNNTQRAALTGYTVVKTIRATTTNGSGSITSFGAGTETITVPYALASGQESGKLKVYYLSYDGKLTDMNAKYENGKVSFATNHNSDFVIIYGPNKAEEEAKDEIIPVYRAYNRSNGDHLLTTAKKEYDFIVKSGWQGENSPFKVSTKQGEDVYRLYNRATGEHFFTKNATERANDIKAGWVDEGSPFKSNGSTPVYRVYNPNQKSNNHHYTTNITERNNLIRSGWNDEGIVFYVQK